MQTTINYQCFAMTRGINIIAILVACTTAASAVLAPFPHGKTTVYNYRTTVKSTTSDDSLYASQFVLQGTLDITHDTRDPELANAYSVVFSNVVTDMHNGKAIDYDGKEVLRSIDGNANVIQAPFLIIYNPNGTFQALKVGENESEWSRNMKMAMAAMLQLDLPNINVKKLKNDNHSFVTQEKTIYGDCSVTYNLDSVYRASPNTPEEFRVSKDFSPIDCDGFGVQEFNNVDNDHCKAKKPEHMFTGSTRDFEFEQQAGGILIKKLNSYGVVRTIPANAAAYSHIVITNTTFEFLGVKEKSENDAQLGNFSDSQKIYDLTYRKPEASYVPNAAIDVTQGRHVVNVSSLPSKLEELLSEAFNYVEENHLSPNEIHWNHAQAINNILHTMRYMDEDGLQATFDRFEKPVLRRDIQMKNIFLGVVAQVGTPASCNFARNIILKNKISALSAVDMLTKLPLSVKVPTTRLLSQMEDLAKFDDAIPAEVRKAGILCFSSLVYRTFKNLPHPETSDILNKYLHDFLDHVENEPTYEMKFVYLMAIKNIQVGKIYHLLEPIINGTRVLTQDPERFLLLTIWAIDKAVEEDYTVATRMLWPLMVNNTLSTKVRIAAYDILMNQAPDEKTARKVHEYVSTEGNEHFYNYHYTTLDSIARSVDQCKNDLRTIVKSILEETQYPRDADANIHYPLSGIYTTNYASFAFKYAEKIDIGVVVNEVTGDPEVLNLEYETVDNDGSVSDLSIHMHIEGHHSVMKGLGHNPNHSLTATKILDILLKASSSVPARKKLKIDIVLMRNGRVLIANHYNYETLGYITRDLSKIIGNGAYNYQYVRFDRLYEKQLTSDIGVPIIVETRVPIVTSMQINFTNTDVRKTLAMDWDIELKKRTHGDYSMSVYNPMKDVWHVVRSVTATEVNLPLHTLITFHRAFKTLKMSFPKRLETTPSIAGILIRGKHLVTIDEEGTRKLMESCHICLNKENIPYLCLQEDGKMMKSSFDIKSLGLKFSSHMDIGEYGPLSERYSDYVATWDTTFMSKISNSWSDVLLKSIMDVRRVWKDITFTSQLRSRSYVLKLEPSSSYPICEINARLLGEYEDYDRNETTSELLHAKMYRNSVTFKTISSLTNKTAGMLNIDVKIHVNRGHLRNNVSVQITQKTPEEQKLKICIDAVKKFPAPPADYLKLTGTNEEIDSELTVYYGYTDGTECVLNETMISLTVKAQLSDEQKMRFKEDLENSACSKETKSPLYASLNSSSVPRTINCLNEAIRYTTPRKYTFDVKYEKLSLDFASFICDIYGIHEDLRENGNFQLRTQFPMTMNNIDLELMNNSSDFSTAVLPLKNLQPDGLGPVMKPLWDFPLDNSRFNIKFLHDYTDDRIRFCSVYPEIIHRGDGNKQPFTIPSDEWTLISGDYVNMKFAIFVKQTRPNYLSFQLFIKDHRVHFFTRESDNMLVAVGDGIEPGTTNGLQLPAEEHLSWRIKVKKANDHFVVRMWTVPLTLYIGSNYISIPLDSSFQGHVGGLCGHLSGSVFSNKSDIFSTNDID